MQELHGFTTAPQNFQTFLESAWNLFMHQGEKLNSISQLIGAALALTDFYTLMPTNMRERDPITGYVR